MNIFTKLSCVTATLLLSGLGTMAAAQETTMVSLTETKQESSVKEAFDHSKQRCIDKGWMETSCFTTTKSMGTFPLGEFINEMNSTIESFRAKNGWGKEITLKTIVPIGSTFAYSGRGV